MQKVQEENTIDLHGTADIGDDDESQPGGLLSLETPCHDLAAKSHTVPDAPLQIYPPAAMGPNSLPARDRRMFSGNLPEFLDRSR